MPRYIAYSGPLFKIESLKDESFGHMWRVDHLCKNKFYDQVFGKMSKSLRSGVAESDGVYFLQEWELSLSLHRDMFPDSHHILRVSYEL